MQFFVSTNLLFNKGMHENSLFSEVCFKLYVASAKEQNQATCIDVDQKLECFVHEYISYLLFDLDLNNNSMLPRLCICHVAQNIKCIHCVTLVI